MESLQHGQAAFWRAILSTPSKELSPEFGDGCADKDDEHVELLQLDQSGIRIASYLTALPPRAVLQQKLHETVRQARARLEARPADELHKKKR